MHYSVLGNFVSYYQIKLSLKIGSMEKSNGSIERTKEATVKNKH